MKIYFDNASAQLPTKEVVDFTQKKILEFYGSSNQIHTLGQKSKAELENSRTKLASLLNTQTNTLFFTSGRTESNNIAVNIIGNGEFSAIITSIFEHASVLEPLKNKSKKLNIPIYYVDIEEDTGINLNHLKQLLKQNPNSFVSLAHVNRLTGRLLPISRVAKYVHKYSSIFHSDMSQTLGKVNVNLVNLDVDIMTASADLSCGIRGAGFIYAKQKLSLKPLFYGNNEESGIRSGVENISAISTMVFAQEQLFNKLKPNWTKVQELKNFLKTELDKNQIKYSSVCFVEEHFLPHIINIEFQNIKNFDAFLIKLDMNDIYIADVRLISLNMLKNIQLSFSPLNFKEEITYFVNKLSEIQ